MHGQLNTFTSLIRSLYCKKFYLLMKEMVVKFISEALLVSSLCRRRVINTKNHTTIKSATGCKRPRFQGLSHLTTSQRNRVYNEQRIRLIFLYQDYSPARFRSEMAKKSERRMQVYCEGQALGVTPGNVFFSLDLQDFNEGNLRWVLRR